MQKVKCSKNNVFCAKADASPRQRWSTCVSSFKYSACCRSGCSWIKNGKKGEKIISTRLILYFCLTRSLACPCLPYQWATACRSCASLAQLANLTSRIHPSVAGWTDRWLYWLDINRHVCHILQEREWPIVLPREFIRKVLLYCLELKSRTTLSLCRKVIISRTATKSGSWLPSTLPG